MSNKIFPRRRDVQIKEAAMAIISEVNLVVKALPSASIPPHLNNLINSPAVEQTLEYLTGVLGNTDWIK